jgi:hypothetical protein
MVVHFFFGALHDALKENFNDFFISRYSFLIPFISTATAAVFVYIKKRKSSFIKPFNYLNLLLLILLLTDVVSFTGKLISNDVYGKKVLPGGLAKCDTCVTPDVYWIVADEYAGSQELKEVFHFENTDFEKKLQKMGFHVIIDSRSNYNITPFSIASTLNLTYLPLKDTGNTINDVPMVMGMIGENVLSRFFHKQGYTLFNNSVFNLPGESQQAESTFLPNKTEYITAQTFLSRMEKDLSYHLVTTLKLKWVNKTAMYANRTGNHALYKNTIETSRLKTAPKFSYTHLSMPHSPYYYNETGEPVGYDQLFDYKSKPDYLSYLKYTNKKLLSLVDQLIKNSAQPPVIFLMSDHGFRETDQKKYHFMNLCAIYTSEKKYDDYYAGLSSVNVFRIFLNAQFKQQLPLLPDSTIFLKE